MQDSQSFSHSLFSGVAEQLPVSLTALAVSDHTKPLKRLKGLAHTFTPLKRPCENPY
jgi:hypothetical protein